MQRAAVLSCGAKTLGFARDTCKHLRYAAVPTAPGVALQAAVASAAPSSEADGPAYTGQIVDYNEDKGFGFIECKETQQIYGRSAG